MTDLFFNQSVVTFNTVECHQPLFFLSLDVDETKMPLFKLQGNMS